MSERYSKLFSLPPNLYSEGAPVLISAGALLKDNQTDKVLAQLKIQNISDKPIKAATVKLVPADTTGKLLGNEIQHQYLDLNSGRDADFGQKTPVSLPDASTRGFSAAVSEVIFADNTIWTDSNTPWEPLSSPSPLDDIGDSELVKQYRIKYGADCKYIFKTEKDLWYCACGAVNRQGEFTCHHCGKEAAAISAVDIDALETERDERLDRERTAAAAQIKKRKKIATIVIPVAVIAIVAIVLISNFAKAQQEAYDSAVALAEAGNLDKAIAAFTKLGDYKDSAEQLLKSKYEKAVHLIENAENLEDVEEANALFIELDGYADSAERVEWIETYREYVPYIGEFVCMINGAEYHLSSDFTTCNGNVCWKVELSDGQYGIFTPEGEVLYSFFDEDRIEELVVSTEMSVSDEWSDGQLTSKATATFANGDIAITVDGFDQETGSVQKISKDLWQRPKGRIIAWDAMKEALDE